jgi:hypothetical protein
MSLYAAEVQDQLRASDPAVATIPLRDACATPTS